MLNGITPLKQNLPLHRAQPSAPSYPELPEQTDQLVLSPQSPDFSAAIQKTARPGTLYILDGFAQSPPSLSVPGLFAVAEHVATHGELVQQAAREIGFQGPIVAVESHTLSSAAKNYAAATATSTIGRTSGPPRPCLRPSTNAWSPTGSIVSTTSAPVWRPWLRPE